MSLFKIGTIHTEDWIDNTKAFIHAMYPGMGGAQALTEIIFGMTNPSGEYT